MPIDLGFRSQGLNIGGETAPEGGQGPHTTPRRGQEGARHPWCGGSLASLRLSFGLRLASGKNRRFRLRFVQFREYFLCSFSETHKWQKTGN
jgi:hypothetical protein